MSFRGQRFELDLDADNWQFNVQDQADHAVQADVIKEVKERETSDLPQAPTLKTNISGFPEHRRRPKSAFKLQQQAATKDKSTPNIGYQPSDRAIINHAVKKRGIDLSAAKERSDISAENDQRINHMSLEEIEEARSELMQQFNPESLRKLLQRANVDEDQKQQDSFDDHEASRPNDSSKKSVAFADLPDQAEQNMVAQKSSPQQANHVSSNLAQVRPEQDHPTTDVHFPAPPRNKADYKPLDPSSVNFLTELREHYFPDLPHDPNALSWLQDPTPEEDAQSAYNPERIGFAPSAIRFSFAGSVITPTESLKIPTTKGLHHHGEAPSSAGYAIPELALLCRSTLPNQRCVAYQVLGRILFRLGRGDFGSRGSDLVEGLWTCIEKERPVEVMMAEANRDETKDRVHLSAKAYATEGLWLWRRGGGGDRGVLKETEMRAQ